LPLSFVALLFYFPISKIAGMGFASGNLLFDGSLIGVIWFTIWQALLSTAITLALALPAAHVLYKRSFKGQLLVRALITVPFILPTIVVAIGFTVFRRFHEFYKELGIGIFDSPVYWIIAAHVFVNFSIAVRTIGGVMASSNNDIEEAAELDGAGRIRTFFSISLPLLTPAIVSAAALVFLFSATSFGIVLVLGSGQVNTIETAIYFAATQFLDLEKAAVLVLVQTLITASAFSIGSVLSKGSLGLEQVFEGERKPSPDKRDLPATVLAGMVGIGLLLMPMVLVVFEAFRVSGGFGFENFWNLGTRGSRDLLNISVLDAALNSLRNMVVSSLLAFSFGVVVSWLLVRSRFKLLDLIFLLPLGISSVVLGFGFLVSFDSAWLPLRSSWLIVPLAQALIALPMVIRLVYPALLSLSREYLEQAKVDGATSWQSWRFVESRMIHGVLVTAFSYAAIISLGEFGASSFLAYGSQSTIPTLLFRLISRPGEQNYGMSMAIATIIIVISFLVVYLSSRSNRRSLL
jgi:thiamine transport system permease protein